MQTLSGWSKRGKKNIKGRIYKQMTNQKNEENERTNARNKEQVILNKSFFYKTK